MSTNSSPRLGTQSPVQLDRHQRPYQPRSLYPPVQSPQRPQPAYTSHVRRQSDTQRTDTTRMQSSVSSAESGSSGLSGWKANSTQQTFWHASSMEQGLATDFNEKHTDGWNSPHHQSSQPSPQQEMAEDNSAVLRYIREQHKLDSSDEEDDHAVWILFWLSCLDPIHSIVSAVYTVLVSFTLILASPIRLCRKQSSLGDQLVRALAPIFRNRLEMMYAPSVEEAFSFQFRPGCLVAVHLSAPFLSLGVMIAGWVSAAFWLFSGIMGNPDGTERRDDGRDTVIQVRDWWERYLLNAIEG